MDAVEDIKQRLSIEDVVGEYVQLKRAGRNWKGLSPFTSERSPSFMVSPEKQIWHDFSSGKGGNMFSFVMEMEGLDFRGALELLARKAGIDLEQYRRSGPARGDGKQKERLYEALEWATKFYQTQLKHSQAALEYVFKKRAFTKETVLAWRLGYAPNNGQVLLEFLRGKGFSDHELQLAGLSARRFRGGTQDMFRSRLMIPLQDPQGRVIGFTARLLADDPNAPKYLNTPQTPLYDKSRHVFGLHFAKEAIRKSKFVVVAEGNLDVVMSHQAGLKQVVATAGTALTEQHLKALSRFTGDIRLCFDADRAGLAATERAIPIASRVGVSLSVITIPSGKDPDELIRNDAATWPKIVAEPKYALDWLIDRYQTLLDLSTAPGKREFSDVVLNVVRGLSDQVEQEHYVERVSDILHVSREALQTKLVRGEQATKRPLKRPNRPAPAVLDREQADRIKTANHLLAIVLLQPKARGVLGPLAPEMFVETQAQTLLNFLQTHEEFDGKDFAAVEELRPIADYVKILILLYEELYQDVEPQELQYELDRLRPKLIEQYVKTQKRNITEELQAADEARTTTLLAAAKQLDELLKTHKGGR